MTSWLRWLAAAPPFVAAAMMVLLASAYVPARDDAAVPSALMQPKAMVALVLVPLLLAACAARLRHTRAPLPVPVLVLVSVLVAAYVLVFAARWPHAHHEALLNLALYGGVLAAVAVTPLATRGILVGLLSSGLVVALLIVLQSWGVQLPGWRPSQFIAGPAGTFLHRNTSAYLIAAAIPCAVHLALRCERRWPLGVASAAMIVLGGGLVLSRSRGTLLAALVALAWLLCWEWRGSRRRWRGLGMVALLALGGALAGVTAPPLKYGGQVVVTEAEVESLPEVVQANIEHERVATRLNVVRSNESFQIRLEIWAGSLRGIEAHPWLGWGPGRFPALAEAHGLVRPEGEPFEHAHNDYLQATVEAGALAGGALLAIALVVAWTGLRRQVRDPGRSPPVLLAAAAVFALRSLIEHQATAPAINLFAACALGAVVAGLATDAPSPADRRGAGLLTAAAVLLAAVLVFVGPYLELAR